MPSFSLTAHELFLYKVEFTNTKLILSKLVPATTECEDRDHVAHNHIIRKQTNTKKKKDMTLKCPAETMSNIILLHP
jgi:hypothetical protein